MLGAEALLNDNVFSDLSPPLNEAFSGSSSAKLIQSPQHSNNQNPCLGSSAASPGQLSSQKQQQQLLQDLPPTSPSQRNAETASQAVVSHQDAGVSLRNDHEEGREKQQKELTLEEEKRHSVKEGKQTPVIVLRDSSSQQEAEDSSTEEESNASEATEPVDGGHTHSTPQTLGEQAASPPHIASAWGTNPELPESREPQEKQTSSALKAASVELAQQRQQKPDQLKPVLNSSPAKQTIGQGLPHQSRQRIGSAFTQTTAQLPVSIALKDEDSKLTLKAATPPTESGASLAGSIKSATNASQYVSHSPPLLVQLPRQKWSLKTIPIHLEIKIFTQTICLH